MEADILPATRDFARLGLQDAANLASNDDDRHLSRVDADGTERSHQRQSARCLHTVVGPVTVNRETYAARDPCMLASVDAARNLPARSYTFGVRRLVAEQAALVSSDFSMKRVGEIGDIQFVSGWAPDVFLLTIVCLTEKTR